jgi:hypothetical protein
MIARTVSRVPAVGAAVDGRGTTFVVRAAESPRFLVG